MQYVKQFLTAGKYDGENVFAFDDDTSYTTIVSELEHAANNYFDECVYQVQPQDEDDFYNNKCDWIWCFIDEEEYDEFWQQQ